MITNLSLDVYNAYEYDISNDNLHDGDKINNLYDFESFKRMIDVYGYFSFQCLQRGFGNLTTCPCCQVLALPSTARRQEFLSLPSLGGEAEV